jgi:hypothetical protein
MLPAWCLAALLSMPSQDCQETQRLEALTQSLTRTYERDKQLYYQPELEAYLEALAAHLAGRPLTVRIILAAKPVRAAAYGGRLYLSTGLLAAQQTEADLAAVLPHLVAHALDPPSTRAEAGGRIQFIALMDNDFLPPMFPEREERAAAAVPGILRRAGYDGPNAIVTTSSFQRMRELLPTSPARRPPTLLR